MELTNFNSEQIYSSLYLVEQINIFRKEEGNQSELRHSDFLKKIEKEFDDEIAERNISPSSYLAGNGKQEKCYELTFEHSLQILMSESKTVRKRVIDVLKQQQEKQVPKLPTTYIEALEKLIETEKEKQFLLTKTENAFNWRLLKAKSHELGYVVKKAESPRFGFQNLYHVDSFKAVYPQFNYNLKD